MKKRFVLFAVLIMLAGAVFAQNNWVSFEAEGLGMGLRYEYIITPNFTVGGYFSYIPVSILAPLDYPVTQMVEFGVTARWYPFARRFFTELSVGCNGGQYLIEERTGYPDIYYSGDVASFCIAPGFGWTIDVGKNGGFFLAPGIRIPLFLGEHSLYNIVPYIGLGFAF